MKRVFGVLTFLLLPAVVCAAEPVAVPSALPDDKQVKFLLHFQIVPGNKLLMQYNVFRLF